MFMEYEQYRCWCLYIPNQQLRSEEVLFFFMGSINPLRAKFFWGNISIYLHFVSFLYIDTTVDGDCCFWKLSFFVIYV